MTTPNETTHKFDNQATHLDYYPQWLDRLADDVILQGAVFNGELRGAEQVGKMLSFARSLYAFQDFRFYGMRGYVDSSLERVQVKCAGLVPSRHVIMCGGQTVPLAPTGTAGEGVAGVRYRAWQPPSALHPTIGIHSPLVFDVVDTWSGRSLGGCRYHVFHPGGKAPETFPVNSNEAEGRRLARFEAIGHTAGTLLAPALYDNPEYPHTLDLRRTR